MPKTVGEIIRKAETEYIRGTTTLSKHVNWSMLDTLNRIDAYMNSKHISGDTDTLGREKPFFNICTAAVNIWFRATDIDRKDIKLRGTKATDWLDAFLATVHLRDWMRREAFGQFLNYWGYTLSEYCSAVVKFVQNSSGLHISVVPWQQIICDPVDFDNNPCIEMIELTEAQLRDRIDTMGYDATNVEALINATNAPRQTVDRQRKDNRPGYYKVYEIHGKLSKDKLTDQESDAKTFVQQMHVLSFVGKRVGRNTEYTDFTLYRGVEKDHPYELTHLIKTEGRTLSIGAVEHLFEAQWMTNHAMKLEKDTLDLSSLLLFQTQDGQFLNRNALSDMITGDILVHGLNMPLTKVDTSKPDIASVHNFAMEWKALGLEINGISEAMAGKNPPSGTAWRQVATMLQEGHSLFELMIQNKALHLEKMLRERILPYIKEKELNHSNDIGTTLELNEIHQIDSIYFKAEAIKRYNEHAKNMILDGQLPAPFDQQAGMQQMQQEMQPLGNQRFFKPSDVGDKTWKEQFKDLEWELEIDITDENSPTKEDMQTLTTALQTVATNPRVLLDDNTRTLYYKLLTMSGAMSPLEVVKANPIMPPPVKQFREMLDYADAPEDIKRQMEEQLGFKPSQMQPPPQPATIPGQ